MKTDVKSSGRDGGATQPRPEQTGTAAGGRGPGHPGLPAAQHGPQGHATAGKLGAAGQNLFQMSKRGVKKKIRLYFTARNKRVAVSASESAS